jgi:hypothetical protein
MTVDHLTDKIWNFVVIFVKKKKNWKKKQKQKITKK